MESNREGQTALLLLKPYLIMQQLSLVVPTGWQELFRYLQTDRWSSVSEFRITYRDRLPHCTESNWESRTSTQAGWSYSRLRSRRAETCGQIFRTGLKRTSYTWKFSPCTGRAAVLSRVRTVTASTRNVKPDINWAVEGRKIQKINEEHTHTAE